MTEKNSNPPRLKLMFSEDDRLPTNVIRMHHPVYGGNVESIDGSVRLPFILRKEAVELNEDGSLLRIIEPAVERVTPRCPHFGICGGCQYQMIDYHEQLNVKRMILRDLLHAKGLDLSLGGTYDIPVHAAEPYAYRNRIRLRIQPVPSAPGEPATFRLGYNIGGTTDFLPITTCPISAPGLFATAESLLSAALTDRDAAFWLAAASEIELFANHDLTRIQITLLCAPRTKSLPGSFDRAFAAFQTHAPIQIAGLGAIASDPRTGPTGRTLDSAGSPGLNYTVETPNNTTETYWITRGGFFQVNRFLFPTLVRLVTQTTDNTPRAGTLAWDLFAGVGLFSRVLARHFTQVIAVEANPTATADNRAALTKLSPAHQAIEATTLDFLRRAVLDRDRPDLVVLDPPRAGAGLEACDLLTRIAPPTIIYVSCDPTTLARDLAALQPHYTLDQLHLLDLFPQTSHLETIAILHRRP
jgi:23S rRNA (uracil1939-C5)-methyltransferase